MDRMKSWIISFNKANLAKRLSALCCFLAFTLMTYAVAFGEDLTDGKGAADTQISYDDNAVNLLIKLNILEISDSSMTTIAVTREDFAVYTANLLGVDTNLVSSKRYFVDTNMESYGTYAIEKLVDMGIISRSEDDKFRPNDKITLNEAVKIMCEATGYGDYAERRGGFPNGYLRCARENGFLITPQNVNELTMTEAAHVIFEAAKAAIYEPIAYSQKDGTKYSSKNENTLLSVYHKIYYNRGRITGLCGRTLDRSIDDEKIRIIDGDKNEEEFDIKTEIAKDDFLGEYVDYFYYKELSESVGEIVYMYSDNNERNIKISSKDLVSASTSAIKYYDEKSKKEKILSLENPIIVYNGTPLKTKADKMFADIKKGFVSIKRGTDKGDRDAVIIDDYINLVLNGTDADSMTLYNKLNSKDYFSLNDYEKVRIFDSGMNRIDFSDIKDGSAVSVAKPYDNNEIITLIVSNTLMNGTLEAVKNNGDEYTVTVSGKDYVVDKSYANEFKTGTSVGVTYYYTLDFLDEIVYSSEVSSDSMSFGYILKAILNTDSFDKEVKIKMINADAKIEYAVLADRVRIDGVTYKNDGKKMFWALFASNNGSEREMPLRYLKDADGKIKEIDTPYVNEPYETNKNSLSSVYDENFTKRYGRSGRLGLKAYLNNNTKVFQIPSTPIYGEMQNSDVKIGKGPDITFQEYSNANVYTTSILNEYSDMVVKKYEYSQIGLNDTSRTTFVVSNITEGLDDDGAVCKILCGYLAGVYKEYKINSGIDISNIGEGDIVKLHFDVNENPIPTYTSAEPDIQVLYDYSKLGGERPTVSDGWLGIDTSEGGSGRCYFASSSDAATDYYYAKLQLSFGYAHRVTGDMVQIGYKSGADFDETFRTTNIKVTIVDKTKKQGEKVYIGSVNDIEDFSSVENQCSRVIVHTRSCDAMSLIVFKQ